MPLPTAIELAAKAPEREPSDQELLAGYQPSFPHPIDPNSEVVYGEKCCGTKMRSLKNEPRLLPANAKQSRTSEKRKNVLALRKLKRQRSSKHLKRPAKEVKP